MPKRVFVVDEIAAQHQGQGAEEHFAGYIQGHFRAEIEASRSRRMGMNREQAAEIFEHLFVAARDLDEARAAAFALAEQDESAASLEAFIFKLNSELIEALFDRFPDLMPFEEFPAISSTLRWDQVRLPPSLNERDVDAIILSVMKPQWQKVAMILGLASERCKELALDLSPEMLGARIQALAESDRIRSQGDLRKWRFSEARLKD
jgi:Protein of unknown function